MILTDVFLLYPLLDLPLLPEPGKFYQSSLAHGLGKRVREQALGIGLVSRVRVQGEGTGLATH